MFKNIPEPSIPQIILTKSKAVVDYVTKVTSRSEDGANLLVAALAHYCSSNSVDLEQYLDAVCSEYNRHQMIKETVEDYLRDPVIQTPEEQHQEILKEWGIGGYRSRNLPDAAVITRPLHTVTNKVADNKTISLRKSNPKSV
jgi:hypothetical protein